MFKILEDEKMKLAVFCAFRGSGKSTIITTAFVLWSIFGFHQKKFIVICGQTELKARQYLRNIKEQLMHNELLKKDLGPFTEEKDNLGNATAIIIKKLNVKIMISSVEQSIRGMKHNQHRPDLIIIDDIEDISSVKTKEGRDKAFDWFTGELVPAGDRNTRIIAVGNLLHEDSVLKRLQKKINDEKMTHLNGIYREYPIVDEKGVALWKGKYPTKESVEEERQKTMNDISWYREYMLQIISTDEQVIKPEWIQFYKDTSATGLRSIGIGVDLAISEKNSADYTAIVSAYVYGHGDKLQIYIQPNPINKRMTSPEQIETLSTIIRLHKNKIYRVKTYIESVGYQEAFVQILKSKRHDVEAVPVKTDKRTRLGLTSSSIKQGVILFPEEGCEELIEQIIGFGKEKHDDLVDAFSILILKIIENSPKQGSSGIGKGDQI
jgi:predicted phage terminase large subunit-like protein